MNADEVIEYARAGLDDCLMSPWSERSIAALLALAEEQAATIARVRELADQWGRETRNRPASEGPVDAWLHECAHELYGALDGQDDDRSLPHTGEDWRSRRATAVHRCDECGGVATRFWPELKTTVQMCDNCTHNATRSGWEPGR